MRHLVRAIALITAGFVLAHSAFAYYYYVHFYSPSAPYNPIPEKFDLNSLPNNTVRVFISNQAPTLVQGDTYQAIPRDLGCARAE